MNYNHWKILRLQSLSYVNKLFFLVVTIFIFACSNSYTYANNNYNTNVPSPIMGVEVGDDEEYAAKKITQMLNREPSHDYLDYTYYDAGPNVGGANWNHNYMWCFDEAKSPDESRAYIFMSARKGKVSFISVKGVRVNTSLGILLGSNVNDFIMGFKEKPYNIINKSCIEYSTGYQLDKYNKAHTTTRISYNPQTKTTFMMRSWSNETYIGESPFTSRQVQLGSSNHSRDGVRKSTVAG